MGAAFLRTECVASNYNKGLQDVVLPLRGGRLEMQYFFFTLDEMSQCVAGHWTLNIFTNFLSLSSWDRGKTNKGFTTGIKGTAKKKKKNSAIKINI